MTIRTPDDFHLHLRQGSTLKGCLPHSASWCARGLVMPNTLPPVCSPDGVAAYRNEIKSSVNSSGNTFEPLMTFKILPSMTGQDVFELKKAGCISGKLYPAGATTNAEDGVVSIDQIEPVLESMEANQIVLSVHGEVPEDPILTREISYIPIIEKLVNRYPKLQIVFEHLSTKEAVDAVAALPSNVAATLTPHHISMTLDDLIGGNLNPYHFCKPVVKQPRDRDAIAEAAVSGNAKFFFGTDSAPHVEKSKLSGSALPGIFCAPVAIPVIAETFEAMNKLDYLEDFVSRFGAEFYQLPLNKGELVLEKELWDIPLEYNGFVPMKAGEQLAWKVIRRIE